MADRFPKGIRRVVEELWKEPAAVLGESWTGIERAVNEV